jgi:hypothetical protein
MKITIRISERAAEKLPNFHTSEADNNTATASFLTEWAVSALLRAQVQALSELNTEERRAIIAVTNGWMITSWPLPDARMLRAELEDFFAMGEGRLWKWKQDNVSALLDKISTMSSDKTMALILWAKHFWSLNSQDLDLFLEGLK